LLCSEPVLSILICPVTGSPKAGSTLATVIAAAHQPAVGPPPLVGVLPKLETQLGPLVCARVPAATLLPAFSV
jgi:hypothetical protein